MNLRAFGVMFVAGSLVAAGGCKKKPAADKAGSDAGAVTGAVTPGAPGAGGADGDAGGTPTSTATGGELSGLKPITECPTSLEGTDTGVDRTIKKECGTVAVKGDYKVEGSLTIEAGAVLAFQPGARLIVGYHNPSKLKVNGTAADPVRFIAGGDQVPGSWVGVRLAENAARSTLTGLVIENAGSDEGALRIEAVDVSLQDVTIKNAAEIGLWVADNLTVKQAAGLRFEQAGTIAASLPANAVGALGEGNTFTEGGFVQIRGGTVTRDATWRNPGSHYVVERQVRVDGEHGHAKLVILAGTGLRFRPGVDMHAGYHNPGSIDVQGTAEKPVLFTAADGAEPGKWQGVGAYGKGEVTFSHATVQYGGENTDLGAVFVADGGVLTLKNSIIKNNTVGVASQQRGKIKAIDGTRFEGNPTAITLFPEQLGKLGAANTYADGQPIAVEAGTVESDQTWSPQPGAAINLKGTVDVNNAKLLFAAGLELRFDGSGAFLRIGYHNKASLRATGTKDKPVVLRGVRDEAGAWGGVQLSHRAEDNLLEHTLIQDTEEEAAVAVLDNVGASLKNVTFKRVKAGVSGACKAKLTVENLKIDGGAKAELEPTGC